MAKKFLLTLTVLFILFSACSFAGLTIQNVVADNNLKVTQYLNPAIVWYDGSGQIDTYVDLSKYTQKSHYLRSTYNVKVSEDGQWINNKLTMNQYRVGTCKYYYDYSSAITFTVQQNEDNTAGIVVTTGNLFLNGSLLTPDLGTTDTYTVPTSQTLIATWDYTRSNLSGTTNPAYNIRETAPLVTASQDIYLQGYTLPIPEPATIGLLGLGGIFSLFSKRRA